MFLLDCRHRVLLYWFEMKIQLEMTLKEFKWLAAYLEAHESDIANEINDFGDLKELFVIVFGEEPTNEPKRNT